MILELTDRSNLEEIFSWIVVPNNFQERVDRFKKANKEFPFIKKVFEILQDFSDFTNLEEFELVPKTVMKIKGTQSITISRFFEKELHWFRNSTPMKKSVRKSKALQIIDFLDPVDAKYVLSLIRGKFEFSNKKMNLFLIRATFPDLVKTRSCT